MFRTLLIPVNIAYLVKKECIMKAKTILFHNQIDMRLQPLAEEIRANTILYYIAKQFHWNWLQSRTNPINLEDGNNKLYRRIIYKIIWIIPSR